MTQKHTPAPWVISKRTKALTIESTSTGCRIAQCSKDDKFTATQLNNANLIAAALELLREAELDLQMLIDLRDTHLNHAAAVVRALVQKRVEATQAAITKAKGDAA